MDTTTLGGMPVFHIFGALAQFECDLICKRASAWLRAAGARAVRGAGGSMCAKAHLVAGLTMRGAAAHVKVGKIALHKALDSSAGAAKRVGPRSVPA